MKKVVVILLACLLIIVMWISARVTHVFETYAIPTTSMQPGHKPGSIIMASRFKKPGHNDLVCFKNQDKSTWMFRCIGTEGDIVEIRGAKVYLNGKLLNESYAWNEYYISNKQLDGIRGYVEQDKNPMHVLNDSTGVITLSDNELKKYNLDLQLYTSIKGQSTSGIFADFKKLNYNEDNMGPIKVPQNSYFLLGDNRHDAMDSRYLGLIANDDIISTVIN